MSADIPQTGGAAAEMEYATLSAALIEYLRRRSLE